MIMNNGTIVKVKIADLAVLREKGIIITVGLGSCVGISIYDGAGKVGGLAHIFLADSEQFKHRDSVPNKAKYADTAIPQLLQLMEEIGGIRHRFRAKIAGGSQLFSFNKTTISIGEKNVEAVRRALQQQNVPIVGEDVGGNYGRTMRLFVDSGRVTISTVGKGELEL